MKGRAGRIQELFKEYLLPFDKVSKLRMRHFTDLCKDQVQVCSCQVCWQLLAGHARRGVCDGQELREHRILGCSPAWQSRRALPTAIADPHRLVGAQRRKRRGRPGISQGTDDMVSVYHGLEVAA